LDANVLDATLALGKPHEHAAALGAVGQAKRAASAPLAAKHLTHPYPAVRFYARDALEAILGRPCDVDLDADAPVLEQAARRCLENCLAVIKGHGRGSMHDGPCARRGRLRVRSAVSAAAARASGAAADRSELRARAAGRAGPRARAVHVGAAPRRDPPRS